VIKKIILSNFRNYHKKEIEFSSGTTLIVGPNAIGKTNILEAVYALCVGHSFRAEEEIEVIFNGKNTNDVARIYGETSNGDALELLWDKRSRFQKLFKVNGVGRRQVDFVGNLRAVAFTPVDIEIIIGSPSTRRKYLDLILSQIFREYRVALSVYNKAVKQRNRLLLRMREEGLDPFVFNTQKAYWDDLLVTNGTIIHKKRKEFLDFVNEVEEKPMDIFLEYDHSVVSFERLSKYEVAEKSAATTLVGPHRDDFKIFENMNGKKREIRLYGSRGEQRLAIFTLKIAELEYIASISGERPILLLDDIFSELDSSNRHLILATVSKQQTIMTTVDLHSRDKEDLGTSEVLDLGQRE
jgi:DNA replication and repair protein RecF